jgi:uncharacterized protein YegL
MNKDKTEVVFVLDRSGSMSSIKKDVEGGLKSFIEKQKKEPGQCSVSLFQFDTEYESVFENKDIKTLTEITVVPRGGTALFDAIGKTINSVGERLSKISEEYRPGLVIVNVITDGEENSSKEFKQEVIKEMVRHQTEKYNWQFIFLGANQDAIFNGNKYGFSTTRSLSYSTSSAGIGNTFSILSSGIACMRTNVSQFGQLAQLDSLEIFSDQDRIAASK